MQNASHVRDELQKIDMERSEKSREFSLRFVSGFMAGTVAERAKSQGWDKKLENYALACAEFYSNLKQNMKNTPCDIYKSLPNVKGIDKIEWKIREDIRKQVNEGQALTIMFPSEIMEAWNR